MEKEKIRNELIAVFEETMNCKFRKKHYASDMEEMLEKHSAFLQETIDQCEKSEEMRDFVVSCIPDFPGSERFLPKESGNWQRLITI